MVFKDEFEHYIYWCNLYNFKKNIPSNLYLFLKERENDLLGVYYYLENYGGV